MDRISERDPHMQPVTLDHAYLLLNHGPTVLISTSSGGRDNVMAASWSMPLDFNPPKVAVVIDKSTLTRELVERSREFVLNVPVLDQALMTKIVGTDSGRDADKFGTLGIERHAASLVEAPLIGGCAAWLECKVIREPHIQFTYDLFLAEVVAAWADDRYFRKNRWHLNGENKTIHYLAGGAFLETGCQFVVADQR